MKKKKIGAIIMSGILACTMTAGIAFSTGCGGKVYADFEMPEGGFDTEKEVEITFYHTMNADKLQPVLNTYIEEFENLYPNITVKQEQVSGGYDGVRDKISTQITVGDQPDIAYCYSDHVALYNTSNAVQTLDTLINSDVTVTRADGKTEKIGLTQEQLEDFVGGYYNEGAAFGDEKMYMMPFSKSTEVMYYNKDFFTQHKDKIKVPETWEELGEVCAEILKITGNKTEDGKTIYPLGYDSEANWFITMCEQLGTPYTSATGDNHFLFNNADNKKFVAQFADWYSKGYFQTKELNGGGYTSDLFKNKRSFMSIGSSAGAVNQRPTPNENGSYPFDVGIAPIPQVDKNNPKAISQGPNVCIFKKDDPQKVLASWLFVKYLTTSPDFQAAFSDASGYIPVIKSASEVPFYKTKLENANGGANIAYLSAKVCVAQEKSYFVSPAFNGSSQARDEVGKLMQAVFANPTKIDEAFANAINECSYFN